MFAKHFGLSLKSSASYLYEFKGLKFLDEFYSTEHLLSLDDTVEDLVKICAQNGGSLK